ncbi:hypothetical protein [Saccharothrix stipae]
MFRKIAGVVFAIAAAALMLTGVSAAAPAAEVDDRVNGVCVKSYPAGTTVKFVWKRNAPTYCLPDVKKQWGSMSGGNEYFYCQKKTDKKVTVGQYWNNWWALTDDDSGNVRVWLNVVYISGGNNGEPVPNLKTC